MGRERGGDDQTRVHVSVLADEVVSVFAAADAPRDGWIIDGTVGVGGHASRILDACPSLRVLGIDQDPEILPIAQQNLARFGARARVRRGRVSMLDELLDEEGIERVVGWLLDLGASSLQFDRRERGFSFSVDGPLDMRMDPDRERTAADIVNTWDENDLADLFFHEGGETRSRKVAHAIVELRRRAPFRRTLALADVVARTIGRGGAGDIHPATRVFQALRRAVNEEGEELVRGLEQAQPWLVDGGRLVVISFHSGEDGVVKRFLSRGEAEGAFRPLTKKPLRPSSFEARANPRSRSALLRAAARVRTRASASGPEVKP
ncbi:MAG: 16S rRNA (cytosine(1402)-N(4))-methyltransferase RsmH [Planctomycetes bacterium]|nr:16S rRNA (cytosine(1402)-N(4))-methyltransferase RsmH [Planctomycetota bacterium]